MKPGEQLGPYRILASIGAGGMGEVFRARDTRLGRDVALKVLHARVAQDVDRRKRFELEARAASALNHPNIVTIHDIGEENGVSYMVTELVEGESLRAAIRRGPLPVRRVIDYGVQVANGLAAAHAAGITHRDLKPENIMLTRDARVKMLDFGLAKLSHKGAAGGESEFLTLSEPGMVIGTVEYMSPEQVRGQAADNRSDFFSLGIVLNEMLTGRKTFQGESAVELMNSILKEDVPDLPETVPPALRQIVAHCVEKDRAHRFQSAQDLSFALAGLLDSSMASTITSSRIRTGPPKRPWKQFAVPLAAVALLGVAAGVLVDRFRTPPSAVWTGIRLGGAAISIGPRVSPDGRLIAFQAMIDGQTQVAIMKPDSGNWTVLTTERRKGSIFEMCWSSDGTRIYFDRRTDVPQGVFSVPALGGDEHLVLENAIGPESLPDGSLLLAKTNANHVRQLHRYWPNTQRLDALAAYPWRGHDSGISRAFPDGREVVFFGRTQESEAAAEDQLLALDLRAGKTRRLGPNLAIPKRLNYAFPMAVSRDNRSVYLGMRAPGMGSSNIMVIPRGDGARARTLAATNIAAAHLDSGPDGSLYGSLMYRSHEVLRFPAAGGVPERFGSSPSFSDGLVTALPDGRAIAPTVVAGREQIAVLSPGKDPVALVDTGEETAPPVAILGKRQIAFLAGPASARAIAVADLDERRIVRRLGAAKGTITNLAASPDGSTIYYTSSGSVWSVPSTDGAVRKIRAGDAVTTEPSGKALIIRLEEKEGYRLIRFPLNGGKEEAILWRSDLMMTWTALGSTAVGSDGRMLLNTSSVDSWFWRPAVLDPRTGKVGRIPLQFDGDIFSPGWTADGRIIALGAGIMSSIWRFQAAAN